MSVTSNNQGQLLIARNSLTKLDNRIQDLFDVQVSIPATGNNEGKVVSLFGAEDNIRRAKEYIQAVCQPECSRDLTLTPSHKELFNSSSLANQIQVACGVSMTTIAEGTRVRVCGREDSVAKATSEINSIIHGADRTSRPGLQDGRSAERNLSDRMNLLTLSTRTHEQPAVPTSGPCSHLGIVEELLRLGYGNDAIGTAIQSAGPHATYNEVLSRITRSPPVVARTTVERVVPMEMPSPQHPPPPPVALTRAPRSANGLRPIIVDGSNVAISHGSGRHANPVFSCRGIRIVVEYFRGRGHEQVYVMVPMWRKEQPSPANRITEHLLLRDLDQYIKYTPSRTVNNRRVAAYDDYYIVELAHRLEGVIVSNDNYRDVASDHPQWKETIDKRLLMFTFVEDMFMPPEDPMGRGGPHLNDFLRHTPTHSFHQECPHGRKCTFGRHCKFSHPDRDLVPANAKKVCPRGTSCTFGDVCKFSHPERDSPQPDHTPPGGVSELEKRASSDSLVGKDCSRPQSPVTYARGPAPSSNGGYPAHQMTSSYPPLHPSTAYSSAQGYPPPAPAPDLHLTLVPRTALHSDGYFEPSPAPPQRPTFPPRSLSSPYLEHAYLRSPYAGSPAPVYHHQQQQQPGVGGYPYLQVATPPYSTALGPGGGGGGGFPNPLPESRELFDRLVAILAGHEDVVQLVLKEHPGERDLSLLVRLCQDRARHSK